MSTPPPRYPLGDMAVRYQDASHTVVKRELRDGTWWYKIRPHFNLWGGTWVPENDPYLRRDN